jgi:hypothetical protein
MKLMAMAKSNHPLKSGNELSMVTDPSRLYRPGNVFEFSPRQIGASQREQLVSLTLQYRTGHGQTRRHVPSGLRPNRRVP